MNNIVIHGRLARDPEMGEYKTQKGEAGKRCRFTVAVNRSFGDEADFFTCIAFGNRAEVINKFFSKGSEIVVSGEMQCNPYTDKNGNKRYPWSLLMKDFDFCGSKKDGNQPVDNIPDGFDDVLDDEDIPF